MNPRNDEVLLNEQRSDQDIAWDNHLAYIANMYQSPARGYSAGMGHDEHAWLYSAGQRPSDLINWDKERNK